MACEVGSLGRTPRATRGADESRADCTVSLPGFAASWAASASSGFRRGTCQRKKWSCSGLRKVDGLRRKNEGYRVCWIFSRSANAALSIALFKSCSRNCCPT
jgi:hypothetical protein